MGSGILSIIAEIARTFGKKSIVHAKLGGTAVHKLRELFLAAANFFRNNIAGIVGVAYYHAFEQVAEGHFLPGHEPYLCALHRVGVLAGNKLRFKRQLYPVHGFRRKENCHKLVERAHFYSFIAVVFTDNGMCLRLHQHVAAGIFLRYGLGGHIHCAHHYNRSGNYRQNFFQHIITHI